MKINGLVVDEAKLCDGVWDIFKRCAGPDDRGALAIGMLPKWLMDAVERSLVVWIKKDTTTRLQCSWEEAEPFVDKPVMRDTINAIIRQVSIGLYARAKQEGYLKV